MRDMKHGLAFKIFMQFFLSGLSKCINEGILFLILFYLAYKIRTNSEIVIFDIQIFKHNPMNEDISIEYRLCVGSVINMFTYLKYLVLWPS